MSSCTWLLSAKETCSPYDEVRALTEKHELDIEHFGEGEAAGVVDLVDRTKEDGRHFQDVILPKQFWFKQFCGT